MPQISWFAKQKFLLIILTSLLALWSSVITGTFNQLSHLILCIVYFTIFFLHFPLMPSVPISLLIVVLSYEWTQLYNWFQSLGRKLLYQTSFSPNVLSQLSSLSDIFSGYFSFHRLRTPWVYRTFYWNILVFKKKKSSNFILKKNLFECSPWTSVHVYTLLKIIEQKQGYQTMWSGNSAYNVWLIGDSLFRIHPCV